MDRKVDSRAMREVNRSIIYDLIRESGDISRTELAKRSSLTKPTVSTIVEELLSEGIVSEVGFSKSEPTGGRRARLLRFNPDAAAYVGLRFGVKSTSIVLANGLGEVREHREVETILGDPEAAVKAARTVASELLRAHNVPDKRVQYVGVAVGGLVEASSGSVVLSPNLNWKKVPLRDLVKKAFGAPAVVFNVTEAAAVAEARHGAAKDKRNFVWVYAGTGIGSAIVADGQNFRGSSGFAGEIGFCRMSADGPVLEEIASGRVIVDRARKCAALGETSLSPNATVEEVLQMAEDGDAACRAIVQEAGAALGLAVAHLVNITNPELVVLGGGVAEKSPTFVQAVDAAVKQQALGPEVVPVVATDLKGRSVSLGTVLLAMDNAVRSVRIVTTSV
jgi:predicted NBD/HSP70 family sugar kinase